MIKKSEKLTDREFRTSLKAFDEQLLSPTVHIPIVLTVDGVILSITRLTKIIYVQHKTIVWRHNIYVKAPKGPSISAAMWLPAYFPIY